MAGKFARITVDLGATEAPITARLARNVRKTFHCIGSPERIPESVRGYLPMKREAMVRSSNRMLPMII